MLNRDKQDGGGHTWALMSTEPSTRDQHTLAMALPCRAETGLDVNLPQVTPPVTDKVPLSAQLSDGKATRRLLTVRTVQKLPVLQVGEIPTCHWRSSPPSPKRHLPGDCQGHVL